MKVQAWDLKAVMKIVFKKNIYTVCDVCQCGTKKTAVYVDNNYEQSFRNFLNEKEIEIIGE